MGGGERERIEICLDLLSYSIILVKLNLIEDQIIPLCLTYKTFFIN